jgi:hypothetical protein
MTDAFNKANVPTILTELQVKITEAAQNGFNYVYFHADLHELVMDTLEEADYEIDDQSDDGFFKFRISW